jgi:hypothetical protein
MPTAEADCRPPDADDRYRPPPTDRRPPDADDRYDRGLPIAAHRMPMTDTDRGLPIADDRMPTTAY